LFTCVFLNPFNPLYSIILLIFVHVIIFYYRKERKKFLTLRVLKPWNRLPREAVDAPSPAVFNARLNGTLSNLVWWKASLPMAGGLGLDDS